MSKKHQVQHKDRREERKNKELIDVKRENNQLKRQIARLTKQLSKALDANGEPVEESPAPAVVVARPKCEACQSLNIKSVKMPTSTLVVCKSCGWRKKET